MLLMVALPYETHATVCMEAVFHDIVSRDNEKLFRLQHASFRTSIVVRLDLEEGRRAREQCDGRCGRVREAET